MGKTGWVTSRRPRLRRIPRLKGPGAPVVRHEVRSAGRLCEGRVSVCRISVVVGYSADSNGTAICF
ncbi:hypothetical protein E2C01_016106 [Portunus trituberculatus]|uniref:Uncharacterized protein n=1 Tax=Portunus trituberculatus TaxID=210409 RepID=A0A5B7DNN6_PORTR|nr:hypothetical protein [Portunus trituberculatus]